MFLIEYNTPGDNYQQGIEKHQMHYAVRLHLHFRMLPMSFAAIAPFSFEAAVWSSMQN
jgi:hypothetical protein